MEEASTLPLYYREISYPGDTLYYTVCEAAPLHGVAGDPVPYTVRTDNLLSALLLMGFVVLTVSVVRSQRFITRQLKDFFHTSYNDTDISETSAEVRFQLFLVVLSCLLLAVTTYQLTTHYIADTFVIDSNLALVAIFFMVFVGYQMVKMIIYQLVNTIFFGIQMSRRWSKLYLFINALEGVMLFPATLVFIYFEIEPGKYIYLFSFFVILAKILTFYKCFDTFFRQSGGFLQSFLYFCTLEIIPLLNLIGGLLILVDNLIYNF